MNKKLTALEALQVMFQELATQALGYQRKIDTAKTDVKKKYYLKKLKKNNEEAFRVLAAMERVKNARRAKVENEKSNLTLDSQTDSGDREEPTTETEEVQGRTVPDVEVNDEQLA